MSGIVAFPSYPRSASQSDFVASADAFFYGYTDLATSWTDMAGRSPTGGLLSTTSTTSLTIGTSQQTLTLAVNKAFLPGMRIMVASTASPTNYFYGTVSSYDSGTRVLVFDVVVTGGSGTIASWTVSASAGRGIMGGCNNRVVVTNYPNAAASTNTRILRYTTVAESTGTAITPATSDTDGASFTISQDGLYFLCISDRAGSSRGFGFSKNSAQLTTDIGSITASTRVVYGVGGVDLGDYSYVSGVLNLVSGDIIRPHVSGSATGGNASSEMITISSIGF